MKSDDVIPNIEAVPEEGRLMRRARSGEADAFVQLYDVYGDNVYRYVYFRVLSDVAAEAITAQVFRYAWDNLESQKKTGLTFAAWIYSIARNQVLTYYHVNLRSDAFNLRDQLAAADYQMRQGSQGWSPGESWGNHLKLLAGDGEQDELQSTAALIMREYLDYLNPRRLGQPHPTFNAYTRPWLTRYLQFHPRRPNPSPMSQLGSSTRELLAGTSRLHIPSPKFAPLTRQVAMVYAVLIAALLFTGTAKAQSALPGDALYGWKRTSEQLWLTVSPDRVGTEITLADRRLAEWIAVDHDPMHRADAQRDYVSVLTSLEATGDGQMRARVLPALQAHERELQHAGLSSQPLDAYLALAASSGSADQAVAAAAGLLEPSVIAPPTSLLATATEFPTGVPGTPTLVAAVDGSIADQATPTALGAGQPAAKVNKGLHKGQGNGNGPPEHRK
ncbi:MAG TPA: sigma factor [Anaerolineales bacterium]